MITLLLFLLYALKFLFTEISATDYISDIHGLDMQCFFDTPGLTLTKGGYPHRDVKVRVESVWSAIDLYDVLIVIFDVHRHLNRLVTSCI